MKKMIRRLQLSRETLHRLDERDVARANGGVVWTGCLSDCTQCTVPVFTKPQPEPILTDGTI